MSLCVASICVCTIVSQTPGHELSYKTEGELSFVSFEGLTFPDIVHLVCISEYSQLVLCVIMPTKVVVSLFVFQQLGMEHKQRR